MKVYAICLVKNEDDIIAHTLAHASLYCDRIFITDNGSTDGTWEIVQQLAKRDETIVAFAQRPEPYDEGLRWFAYDAHHRELADQDWWLILDGDEFLAEDPRPIIEQAMKERADVIKAWQIQFYYTEKDHEAWMTGQDDPGRPIFERRRYYQIDWQEPRLFRNQTESNIVFSQSKLLTPSTPWRASVRQTKGKIYRRRIFNRHYQYRDPIQIEKRLRLRYGRAAFASQVRSLDWQDVLRSSRNLWRHEEGAPWRFSLAGLAHQYWGRGRYAFIRLKQALWGRAWPPGAKVKSPKKPTENIAPGATGSDRPRASSRGGS